MNNETENKCHSIFHIGHYDTLSMLLQLIIVLQYNQSWQHNNQLKQQWECVTLLQNTWKQINRYNLIGVIYRMRLG